MLTLFVLIILHWNERMQFRELSLKYNTISTLTIIQIQCILKYSFNFWRNSYFKMKFESTLRFNLVELPGVSAKINGLHNLNFE